VRVRAFAKINLFLRVLGPRSDGYHDIETILHGIRLGDDLSFGATPGSGVDVEMRPTDDRRPLAPASNLVHRAAVISRPSAGASGVQIVIEKRIPLASGLGGGSSNAAAALVVLNDLWKLGRDEEQLRALGTQLGSDVPYFVGGGTALAEGRGERIASLAAPRVMWFVLGLSNRGLSTAEVYRRWRTNDGMPDASGMVAALAAGDVAAVGTRIMNALEVPAFELRPELAVGKQRLIEAEVLGAGLSGSGPTLFGLAADEAHARAVARLVEGDFDAVEVVRSQPDPRKRLD
jgi:4-diphosphocytidyl-2-C-methyl-D-erythritol kinase